MALEMQVGREYAHLHDTPALAQARAKFESAARKGCVTCQTIGQDAGWSIEYTYKLGRRLGYKLKAPPVVIGEKRKQKLGYVLQATKDGVTDDEIATHLGVQKRTVHVYRCLAKRLLRDQEQSVSLIL